MNDPAQSAHDADPRGLWPRSRSEWILLGFVLSASIVALWPGWIDGLRFPDSHGYIQWPFIRVTPDITLPSLRPAGYPFTVAAFGTGPVLVHVQTWVSLASFGFLGWVVARVPGLLIACLLAISGAVRPWNDAVLTESLACSMLALAVALTWLLSERRSAHPGVWGLAWAAIAIYLVLLRDANFLLVAPLALPFLGYGWRWGVGAAAFVAVLAIFSVVSSHLDERWVTPYYTALWTYVKPDPVANAHFEERGMPHSGFGKVSEPMRAWLHDRGRREYELWVIGRTESYVDTARQLPARDVASGYRARYFRDEPPPGVFERVADRVWWATGPPFWVFAMVLTLPGFEWAVRRRVSTTSWLVAALALSAYGMAFASLYAAGTEPARHILTAALVARFALLLGLSVAIRLALETWAGLNSRRSHGALQRGT